MSTTYADIDSIAALRTARRSAATCQPAEARPTAACAAAETETAMAGRQPAAARPMPVRLTRRGRLAVLLVVFAVAYGVLTLLSAPAASTHQVHHAPAHTVVVEPGETLWDIAASVSPTADPREVVAEIMDLNALTDAGAIRAGQPLFVPAG